MNIGVIGSGFIVDVFCKKIKMFDNVKTYAIWGRHEEKIKSFSNFKKYYTDINKFNEDPNIDIVYIALPNSLHYKYAYMSLKAGKHVILEKPFCLNVKEAKSLIAYAKKHKLFIFESIMTLHIPNYLKIKTYINKIGNIKLVDINFSQYSRKYDKFTKGTILPAFDYKLAGGALMDIGVYSIHFVCSIFGKPKKVLYFPNIEKNIDTSGILIMDYGSFKASLIFGKDCKVPAHAFIQGDKGHIRVNSTVSRCSSMDYVDNDGRVLSFVDEDDEFVGWKYLYGAIFKIYNSKNYKTCYKLLENTVMVQDVLEKARNSACMKF